MRAFEIINKARYEFLNPTEINIWDQEKYIPFGDNNDAPQQFAKLSREVLAHKAVINRKTFYCTGTKFVTEDKKLQELLLNVNNLDINHKTLKSIFTRVLKDDFIGGSGIFEVITDSKESFVYLMHADFTKFRLAKDLKGLIYNPNWTTGDYTKNKYIPYYGEGWVRDGKLKR